MGWNITAYICIYYIYLRRSNVHCVYAKVIDAKCSFYVPQMNYNSADYTQQRIVVCEHMCACLFVFLYCIWLHTVFLRFLYEYFLLDALNLWLLRGTNKSFHIYEMIRSNKHVCFSTHFLFSFHFSSLLIGWWALRA